MAYTVFRSDLMTGTDVAADLVSLRVYNNDDKIAVENGTIVKLAGYEQGQREIRKAALASASDDIKDCAIVASVELFYDERKKNLDEFINEAGAACRGYILHPQDMFSVTADGFVGGTAPAVGDAVGIGANGKIDASADGLGECMAIETVGRYTYYVIRVDSTFED